MRRISVIFVSLLVASVAIGEDSPLVAAAKRTNRKASKTPVITNAKLSKSRAHLSTAAENLAPLPKPEAAPAPPVRPETTAAPASTRPSAIPTTARSVAPQSTAGTVAPTTGAQTVVPQSTGQTVAPQSTGQSLAPQSTARTVAPQGATPRSQQ